MINTSYPSHLLQMRGLKHFGLNRKLHGHKSHLLQMRGLKRTEDGVGEGIEVASFTDAWIETLKASSSLMPILGRIFYRCVD